MYELGKRIRNRRQAKGMTLDEVAREISSQLRQPVGPGYISALERGLFTQPDKERIRAIAKVLELHPTEIQPFLNSHN